MAIIKDDIADVDLMGGNISRTYLASKIGEGDKQADRFGARLFKNKEPVSLIGASCVGYFIRPDGITLVIEGTTSENIVSVVLPQAAYAVSGNFTLTIKISGDDFTNTVRIIDGTIADTTTARISDPTEEFPDPEEYEEAVEAAEAAAAVVNGLTVTASLIWATRYKISVTKE